MDFVPSRAGLLVWSANASTRYAQFPVLVGRELRRFEDHTVRPFRFRSDNGKLSQPMSRISSQSLAVAFFSLVLFATDVVAQEPHRWSLTSAAANRRVASFSIQGKSITPAVPNWKIERVDLVGGRQAGCELIVLNNGQLEITLIPTRGMSILSVKSADVNLGWNSPVKEVVNPNTMNLQSRGGLGWLEGFNEWMVRCGLENNGHPGTDKFINNVGDEATMELTLHGKIGNIPASEVEVVVDSAAPHRLRVRGTVYERSFYGPKLKLQTEVSTIPGSREFTIEDTVTNQGAEAQEYQLLYHANYGAPLLEEGAEFVAAAEKVIPFNDHAAKSLKTYNRYLAPTTGFIEEVYCFYPKADSAGQTLIALKNKAGDKGVSMSYSIKELPYLTLWKNTAAEADGYVTGLEPGTNFPNNRRVERKLGRVPKLAPGETRRTALAIALLTSAEDVNKTVSAINKLQGKQSPILIGEPENKD